MMSNLWRKFVNGEEGLSNVRPLIHRSWQRSKNNNINHQRFENTEILTLSQLKERCQNNEALVRAGKQVLPSLFNFLKELKHTVLLSDKEGYILESVGEPTFLSKVQKVQISPGTNWREDIRGTNVIGTILQEPVPMAIFGWEHYIQQVHFIDCWGAPIKNPQGEIVGVLDISAEATTNQRNYLLDLAVIGARLIEMNLQLFLLEQNFHIYKNGLSITGKLLREGVIAINSGGFITEINKTGALLLGYKREDLIGRLAAEVFNHRCWGFKEDASELYLEMKNGQNVISHLQEVYDDFGNRVGVIGTLQLSNASPEKAFNVGRSESMKNVIKNAEKVARTNTTVLISGESGTGKEKIARYVHERSFRATRPFIPINCAAIPENLIESELFGYVEGAFTGARRGGQPGKFEVAHGGSIFLDEIGDMPLHVQASLLRVLQEKEVYRIGDSQPRKVDVRIIAATNKDLYSLTKSEEFRQDLFYRLNVVNIVIPSLRQRTEDIFELVPYFLRKVCLAHNKPLMEIEPDAYDFLLAYSWPGNIRELENCIERMVVMTENTVLTVDDLPMQIQNINSRIKKGKELEQHTDNATISAILKVLKETNGNITIAAQLLGIGRTTLYRKMKKLGLN